MPTEDPRTITMLLHRWSDGDDAALDELLPQVYAALRGIASNYWRRESSAHTLQPTAVVHEAFVRMLGQQEVAWQSRTQFLAIAATMMRRVLADHARARSAAKRGGDVVQVVLDEELDSGSGPPPFDALDAALNRLERLDPRQAKLVELRFFAGMTIEEAAQSLELSPATVKREWRTAKAFLARELGAVR